MNQTDKLVKSQLDVDIQYSKMFSNQTLLNFNYKTPKLSFDPFNYLKAYKFEVVVSLCDYSIPGPSQRVE